MRRGNDKDVHPDFNSFGFLLFDFPVSAKKYEYVHRDQGESDHLPTPACHPRVAQWYQHRAAPSERKPQSDSSGECKSRIRTCVTGLWVRAWPSDKRRSVLAPGE